MTTELNPEHQSVLDSQWKIISTNKVFGDNNSDDAQVLLDALVTFSYKQDEIIDEGGSVSDYLQDKIEPIADTLCQIAQRSLIGVDEALPAPVIANTALQALDPIFHERPDLKDSVNHTLFLTLIHDDQERADAAQRLTQEIKNLPSSQTPFEEASSPKKDMFGQEIDKRWLKNVLAANKGPGQ